MTTIPISTCLSVFFCYILLGSVLFSFWEGWGYFEGCYFCFVSLVTIGFSDMVPGQSRVTGSAISGTSKSTGRTTTTMSVDDSSGGGGSVGAAVGILVVDSITGRSTAGDTPTPATTTASGSNGREESLDHVDGQLILCSIYILFGMALMAMCFHLTQERFFTAAKKLGKTLHLI